MNNLAVLRYLLVALTFCLVRGKQQSLYKLLVAIYKLYKRSGNFRVI